jgi:DNA-binding GntR family transcriptional regulator
MPPEKKKTSPARLSEIAYSKIKDRITRLALKPGEQIDESALAASLEIGRTPIRESLFRLEAEGLLQVSSGRGFFVRDITLKDLKDLFETLLILERSAVALAARRIQREAIEQLAQLNREVGDAWRKQDYLQVTLLNSRFHRAVYTATGNAFVTSYLNSLQNQSQRLAFICFSAPATIDLAAHAAESIRDHEELISCFTKRDESAAVDVITRHIQLFQKRVSDFTTPSELGLKLTA